MKFVGMLVGSAIAGAAAAAVSAPLASATTDCSGTAVANTVSSVTGSAQQYLAGHPGARSVLLSAAQAPARAEADIRGYFTANPAEYYDLRGILAPIGDVQRTCNVSVLPPMLSAAYDRFMAG